MLAAPDLVRRYDTVGASASPAGVDFDLARGDFVVLLARQAAASRRFSISWVDWIGRQRALLFGEIDLAALDERALTSTGAVVGFVFQSYNLIPSLTAGENVALGRRRPGALAPGRRWLWSASPISATAFPLSYPAESSSALPLRGPS